MNMCITFVSEFIYLLAMLKSSPLITTLGLSLTIPLAVVIDALKGSHTGGVVAVVGSTAVLSSFGFIGWDDHRSFQEEKKKAQAQALAESQRQTEAASSGTYHDHEPQEPEGRARRERQHSGLAPGGSRDSSAISIHSSASFTSSSST